MSDAFEQWAEDKSFILCVSSGDGYINVKEMAREAWQAAQAQSGDATLERYGLQWNGPQEFVATPMADGYWTPWHIAEQALKAQAGDGVNQQLLEALQNMANPVSYLRREAEKDGCVLNGHAIHTSNDPEFLKGIARAAIAAAQEGK